MKQIMFSIICACLVALFFLLYASIFSKELRQQETNIALSQVLENGMKQLMTNSSKESETSILAGLAQLFVAELSSESDMLMVVKEMDLEYGILSVELVQEFDYPNQERGRVAMEKTIIVDQKQVEEKEYVTVSFYLKEQELYKEYTLLKNALIPYPKDPFGQSEKFTGWVKETGEKLQRKLWTGESQQMWVVSDEKGEFIELTEDMIFYEQ